MKPPHSPVQARAGSHGLVDSILRIQALVALILGSSLALVFALGGDFGRVTFALVALLYGLMSLAWTARRQASYRAAKPVEARHVAPRASEAHGAPRIVPLAAVHRPPAAPEQPELDQLAGR